MEELIDTRISVSRELKEHYDKIIEKRDSILEDSGSENKDLIGILNATTSIIKELSKIQQELYNSEKFAVLQQVIVNVLKECDQEVADKVVKALERRYATII